MKRTSNDPHDSPSKRAPQAASDNLCKRLAEEYPEQFARWLFGVDGNVKVEKTEISREPIRADSVIFSRGASETLHAEFQTTMKSDVPLPLRLLDYYVGFKRQNPNRRVRQALVVLKETGELIPNRYEDEQTVHGYDVVKLWEEDPAELMKHDGLLPLATLCRTESSENLLKEVAAKIRRIKSRDRRRETLNWSRVLAGLRYDKMLIVRILKESDMLEESVIYQDIFQKGEQKGEQQGLQKGIQRGLQEGAEQEARKLTILLLEQRLGKVSRSMQQQIEQLEVKQLEALFAALLEFNSKEKLARWLKKHAPKRGNGA